MLKVGITGGIGSGKTVVAEIFDLLGAPVYNADSRAKELMATNDAVISSIKAELGKEYYDAQNRLIKVKLAELVFNDEKALKKLNGIVHPAVFEDFDKWVLDHSQSDYVLKEAALIFESGSYKGLDAVIEVYAPEELRIRRVVERDGLTEEEIRARMKSQMPEDEKKEKSDYVVYNDENQSVIKQVLDLHLSFMRHTAA
ncbi:MAG: dephospho-CoA kinase [Bacteroidetes bacterium]|nr:dephospho-CoA kinase [Bacteroidota bacterium]